MSKLTTLAVGIISAVVAMTSQASASVINIGGSFATPAELGPVGGTLLGGGVPVNVVSNQGPVTGFTGTLTSWVYKNDSTNPYPGGLTFAYLVTSNATSVSDIGRYTVNGFAGFLTDVSYDSTSTGVIPDQSTRSAGSGDTIGFSFGNPAVTHGTQTRLMVIQTNATQFTSVSAQIIDGDIASVTSLGPTPSGGAPEPATLSLAGIGAGALLLRRRRLTK